MDWETTAEFFVCKITLNLKIQVSDNKELLDEVFAISRIIKVEVGVISRSWSPRLITLTESLINPEITKTESNNCFITHWMKKSHVFASSLTVSKTKRANLTWLPLEIMYRSHTWHDYPWPWVSLRWLLYNLQLQCHRCWFHCMLSANQKRDSEFNVKLTIKEVNLSFTLLHHCKDRNHCLKLEISYFSRDEKDDVF